MGVITYLSSFLYQDSDGEQSQKHFFEKHPILIDYQSNIVLWSLINDRSTWFRNCMGIAQVVSQ